MDLLSGILGHFVLQIPHDAITAAVKSAEVGNLQPGGSVTVAKDVLPARHSADGTALHFDLIVRKTKP